MVPLVDLLSSTFAPVQTMILLWLNVADTIALARTCKDLHAELPAVLKATAYKINYHLKDVFQDPLEFRSLQGKCGALLVGSFARRFLPRTVSGVHHFGIVVEIEHYDQLEQYLTPESYVYNEDEDEDEDEAHYLKKNATGQELVIHWHAEARASIASLFSRASETSCLDFISWNKAYWLFAHSIHIKKEVYLLKVFDNSVAQRLRSLSLNEQLRSKTISWNRRRTYMGVADAPSQREQVLEATTFRRRMPEYHTTGPFAYYEIEFDEKLYHPVLRHRFVTLAEDEREGDQVVEDEQSHRVRISYYSQRYDEIKDRLDELTLLELAKISSQTRPKGYHVLTTDVSEKKVKRQTLQKFQALINLG
ncbi:hypothetical protein E8E11_004049 [Didymella keratinophila]|nr:hypothetical protein E8E11_004049 [Didymella keratinophila]